ncbi:MAG: inositol monophosphatase family protein [Thermodesulfobacteriota bacterium]|nr:inositol monophosphatase family protein [Thermodesulfobacteriota bacterium]
MLQTAIDSAQRAGRMIAERYPGGRTVTVKGYRDLVTDADTAAEALILDLIRKRFPDHTIVSEEAGASEISSDYTWIVDPLDGTTNYAHHHPVFAVSIGLVKRGDPLIGVIYDPLRDHTFVAEKGCGAKLNDKPIHVSRATSLENALVGLDWGHSNEVRERILLFLHRIILKCGTLRVLGSATLALAYVAAGWLDAYFHIGLKPWDTAAGMLIIKEAGGRCSTLEGVPYRVDLPSCLATNNVIHDELLAVMQGNDKRDPSS